jgi:hypothetical protein
MVNPKFSGHVPADLKSLTDLVSKFYDKNWMTKVTANEKIFLYAAGMVARRAGVPGFLPDDHMVQLARHMNALSTIDKIDKNEVPVTLQMRMSLIWDIPTFIDKYKGPGSYALPSAPVRVKPRPVPVKPQRKKLPKHSK